MVPIGHDRDANARPRDRVCPDASQSSCWRLRDRRPAVLPCVRGPHAALPPLRVGGGGRGGLGLLDTLPALPTVAVLVAFFLAYGVGQALTDCFQTDTDALSSPYRPLVRGEVARRDVLLVSLAGLLGIGLFLVLRMPWTLVPAALSVAGLGTYTPVKRLVPLAGPFYNAWIVALVPLMAAEATGPVPAAALARHPGLPLALGAVLFLYANFVLVGYLKDVSADRATGYRTFPVAYGLRATAIASHALAAVGLALAAAFVLGGAGRKGPVAPPAVAFLAVGAAVAGRGQVRVRRRPDERAAHAAIADTVRAFVLLCSALAVARHPFLAAPAVLYGACFEVVLARRPDESQI